jgi:hypothetical protein
MYSQASIHDGELPPYHSGNGRERSLRKLRNVAVTDRHKQTIFTLLAAYKPVG